MKRLFNSVFMLVSSNQSCMNESSNGASLCSRLPISSVEDRWEWGLSDSGEFTVASLRRAVDDLSLRNCGPPTLWNKIVPNKIRILNWTTRIDKLPTKENLIKQGIDVGSNICDGDNEGGKQVVESFAGELQQHGGPIRNSKWRQH